MFILASSTICLTVVTHLTFAFSFLILSTSCKQKKSFSTINKQQKIQQLTDQELIIDSKCYSFLWIIQPQHSVPETKVKQVISLMTKRKKERKGTSFYYSPHDRLASLVRVVELLIPEGQEDIALSYNVTDQFGVVRTLQPRLAAGCVHVCVGSKERHERTGLVPTHQQFSAWSIEEAANISYKTGRGTINSLDQK